MNNGWIKLHRKMNENDIMRDANALQLLNWILLNVDHKTGEVTVQRGWLSRFLRQNPNTFYAVVTRLRHKYHMITTTTLDNNQGTKISLLNWDKYQSSEKPSTTPDVFATTDLQLSDNNITRIENKNKEYIKRESTPSYLKEFSIEDFSDIDATEKQIRLEAEKAENWLVANNRKKSNYKAFLRNWVLKVYKKRVVKQEEPKYQVDPDGIARLKAMKSGFEIKSIN